MTRNHNVIHFQWPSFISSSCTKSRKLLGEGGVGGGGGVEKLIARLFILNNLSIPTCIACSSISEAQYTSISIPSSFKAWNPEIVKQKDEQVTSHIRILTFGCSAVVNPSVSRYHRHNYNYMHSVSAVYFCFPERTCTFALLRQIS